MHEGKGPLMRVVELTDEEFEALYGLVNARDMELSAPQSSIEMPRDLAVVRRVMAKMIQSQARGGMRTLRHAVSRSPPQRSIPPSSSDSLLFVVPFVTLTTSLSTT